MNPQQPDQGALNALAGVNANAVPVVANPAVPVVAPNPNPVAVQVPADPQEANQAEVGAIGELRRQMDDLRSQQNAASVASTLRHLRELLARPPAIFDAFATLAALEALVDSAKLHADEKASRYSIILKQTRPLVNEPELQGVLTKLVGSEEEVSVVKEIQKALKSSTRYTRTTLRAEQAPYPTPGFRDLTCFLCGRKGHFMRNCFSRGRNGSPRGRSRGGRSRF